MPYIFPACYSAGQNCQCIKIYVTFKFEIVFLYSFGDTPSMDLNVLEKYISYMGGMNLMMLGNISKNS